MKLLYGRHLVYAAYATTTACKCPVHAHTQGPYKWSLELSCHESQMSCTGHRCICSALAASIGFKLPLATGQAQRSSGMTSSLEWQRSLV